MCNLFNCLQILRRLLQRILLECVVRSAKSIAMPLIGTGRHGFPEDLVLRVMREEFEKFSSSYSRTILKEIKLVKFDKGRGTTVQAQPASGELLGPLIREKINCDLTIKRVLALFQ